MSQTQVVRDRVSRRILSILYVQVTLMSILETKSLNLGLKNNYVTIVTRPIGDSLPHS